MCSAVPIRFPHHSALYPESHEGCSLIHAMDHTTERTIWKLKHKYQTRRQPSCLSTNPGADHFQHQPHCIQPRCQVTLDYLKCQNQIRCSPEYTHRGACHLQHGLYCVRARDQVSLDEQDVILNAVNGRITIPEQEATRIHQMLTTIVSPSVWESQDVSSSSTRSSSHP